MCISARDYDTVWSNVERLLLVLWQMLLLISRSDVDVAGGTRLARVSSEGVVICNSTNHGRCSVLHETRTNILRP
jgi:hypothetical protein